MEEVHETCPRDFLFDIFWIRDKHYGGGDPHDLRPLRPERYFIDDKSNANNKYLGAKPDERFHYDDEDLASDNEGMVYS